MIFVFVFFPLVSEHLIDFLFLLLIRIQNVSVLVFPKVHFWLSGINGIVHFFPLIPIVLDLQFLEACFSHHHCVKFVSDEVIVWLFVVVD